MPALKDALTDFVGLPHTGPGEVVVTRAPLPGAKPEGGKHVYRIFNDQTELTAKVRPCVSWESTWNGIEMGVVLRTVAMRFVKREKPGDISKFKKVHRRTRRH